MNTMNIMLIKQTSLGDVRHSTGHIRAIKRNFPGNDAHVAAAAFNRAPEQYMWSSRWFARRPDGQPSPYDGRRPAGDERR